METKIWQGTATSVTPYTLNNASTTEDLIIKSIYFEFTGTFSGTRVVTFSTQSDFVFWRGELTSGQSVSLDNLHIPFTASTAISGIKVTTTATLAEGGVKVTSNGVAFFTLSAVGGQPSNPVVVMHNQVSTDRTATATVSGKNYVIKDIYVHNPFPSAGGIGIGLDTDTTIGSASYYNNLTVNGFGTAIFNDVKIPYTTDAERIKVFQQGSTSMTFIITGWENTNI